jgi:hypothetical protein
LTLPSFPDIFPDMTDARTRAVKSHRKRLRKRRMKRVEVTVREPDAALVRAMAAALRRDDAAARRLRAIVRQAVAQDPEPSVGKVLNSLPDISGPEFDAVFDEIERSRRDPIMMQVRDVDL